MTVLQTVRETCRLTTRDQLSSMKERARVKGGGVRALGWWDARCGVTAGVWTGRLSAPLFDTTFNNAEPSRPVTSSIVAGPHVRSLTGLLSVWG